MNKLIKKLLSCAAVSAVILTSGCDGRKEVCADFSGAKISTPEAAEKLGIKLVRQDNPAIGDGIAWGVVHDNIYKYCEFFKK